MVQRKSRLLFDNLIVVPVDIRKIYKAIVVNDFLKNIGNKGKALAELLLLKQGSGIHAAYRVNALRKLVHICFSVLYNLEFVHSITPLS